MDLQLKNKTALVTGSSKGIGEAIAVALAREEVHVVVHGRERVQAERVVETIAAYGGRAVAVLGDLRCDNDVERLVAEAQERVGDIDILVNNAGGAGPKNDWGSIVVNDWASSYDRNVLAALRVAACLLPAMRQQGWGRIINISSGAATMPPATGADYSAAKAAINAMTASMAKAVATEGITVNVISPGTIKSSKLEKGFRAAAAARGIAAHDAPWREIERGVLPLFASVPLGRRVERTGRCRRLFGEPACRLHHRRQPSRRWGFLFAYIEILRAATAY